MDQTSEMLSRSRCLVSQIRIGKTKIASLRLKHGRETRKAEAAQEEIAKLKVKERAFGLVQS